jgi:S1-C subfamily serine protease
MKVIIQSSIFLILFLLCIPTNIFPQTAKGKSTSSSAADKSTMHAFNQKKVPIVRTDWNYSKLKEYFEKNTPSEVEGIYEYLRLTPEDKLQPKLKIGIKNNPDQSLDIIYLSGLEDYTYWKAGDQIGEITKTATTNFYTVNWIGTDSVLDEDVYCKIDELRLLNFIYSDGSIKKYLKLFPMNQSFGSDISSSSKQGTGFSISSNGYLVTCQHVINNSKNISVKGINGDFTKSFNVKIVAEDKNNDLAVLKIEDPYFRGIKDIPFMMRETSVDVGENVSVLGFPMITAMGNEVKLTNGIISSRTGYQGDFTCFQISAPVQPGNSGGPLFDKNGYLIGIVNAKIMQAENVSYAIKVKYLTSLLEALPDPPTWQPNKQLNKKSLVDQLKILKNFIYIIEAKN